MKFHPIRKIRSLYYRLSNLIRWAPVIWRDRDYDWAFLFYLMSYKLRRMARHYEECKYHDIESSGKDIKLLLHMAELLDSVSGDAQEEKLLNAHMEKWGELDLSSGTFSKAKTDEENREAREELWECAKEGNRFAELELIEFCKLFQNNIRNMWC